MARTQWTLPVAPRNQPQALAKVSSDGKLAVANTSPGASNVIVDVFAWFD
jgi:hypothetical protein